MGKSKVFEFLGRFLPILKGTSGDQKGIFKYGSNNLLPNENLRLINDSGIAKRATGKLKRYIEADGFSDETAAKFQVNPEQTADEILSEIASYVSYNKGFALTIQREASGKIIAVKCIAFECVRKTEDGNFTYNPLLGQPDFKDSDTKVHHAFFGVKADLSQLELITKPKRKDEKGKEIDNEFFANLEILYVFEKTADNPNYPVPDYYAGIEDIKTSIELQGLDLESVRNAFMPSSILITHEMDDTTFEKDESGNDKKGTSEADMMEKNLKKFTGESKGKDGESGRMRLMWIQVKSMEEAPKLESFDAKSIIEASMGKRDQIERDVCRWVGIHPVLCGYSDAAILGNTQAISNASKDAVDYVNPDQRMISSAFKKIYPTIDWTISQFNFWNVIPPEVYAVLTSDEKRDLAGYPPLPKEIILPQSVTNGIGAKV